MPSTSSSFEVAKRRCRASEKEVNRAGSESENEATHNSRPFFGLTMDSWRWLVALLLSLLLLPRSPAKHSESCHASKICVMCVTAVKAVEQKKIIRGGDKGKGRNRRESGEGEVREGGLDKDVAKFSFYEKASW